MTTPPHDRLSAHLSAELNIDEDDVAIAWAAAGASALAFVTGAVGAQLGGSSKRAASLRVVIGGAVALAATYVIGNLLGTSGVV